MSVATTSGELRHAHRQAAEETSPIVVIGAPFSGCTTLAWSLAQHPRLVPALETEVARTFTSIVDVLHTEVAPLVLPPDDAGGARSQHDPARGPVAQLLRGVAERLDPAPGPASGRRWVVGGSELARQVPLLAWLFPEARLVHVLRDPAHVVDHLVRTAGLDGFALTRAAAESIARRTLAACLEAEKSAPDRVLRIGYEELLAAPERALRLCLTFVGVRWHPGCLWPLRLLSSAPVRPSAAGARSLAEERHPEYAAPTHPPDADGSSASPVPPALPRDLCRLVEAVTAEGSRVLVVSRGDENLVRLRGRQSGHFPQVDGGTYAGHHPADGAAAVEHLEQLRQAGATHLVLPRTGFWWLDHYAGLRDHLERCARLAACDPALGVVWELEGVRPPALPEALRTYRRVPREPSNERAFVIHRDAPPPRQRRALGGTLWAVAAYFNPVSYANKAVNYARFRDGLAATGVPLLTVELAFGAAPFELGSGDADVLLQLRGDDVMWQKERLLNVGLAHLPSECDKVAWLDVDVLFARRDWAQETSALLREHVVVQPFSHCARLRRDEASCEPAMLPFGPGEEQLFYGIAWGVRAKGRSSLARYDEHGHTGFAWAARRSLLERHGLYDANLLGTGDTDIAHAMFGHREYWGLRRLGPRARAHLEGWAASFSAEVGRSVAHVDGVVSHLWHGSPHHRLYDRQLDVLLEFDPDRDLDVDPRTGLYRWGTASDALRDWSREYFAERREEGS
jgi:hypothetical protein